MAKINCFKCIYFAVTWDPKFPKGCKFFGFKSAEAPSVSVRASTGADCACFVEKETKKKDGLGS